MWISRLAFGLISRTATDIVRLRHHAPLQKSWRSILCTYLMQVKLSSFLISLLRWDGLADTFSSQPNVCHINTIYVAQVVRSDARIRLKGANLGRLSGSLSGPGPTPTHRHFCLDCLWLVLLSHCRAQQEEKLEEEDSNTSSRNYEKMSACRERQHCC